MKKLSIALMSLSVILFSCSGDSGPSEKKDKDSTATNSTTNTTTDKPTTTGIKKYDIKSGIVNLETTIKAGGMSIVKKKILYFDDYGMKEAEETLRDDGTVEQTFLSDGKNLITLIHDKKESYTQGTAYQGTAMKYDREAAERAVKAKKVANISVAGKDCDAYEYADPGTNTSNIFAGYKHVLLYMKQTGAGNSETKATKFEEDVAVPAEKFTIPAGYTAKTM